MFCLLLMQMISNMYSADATNDAAAKVERVIGDNEVEDALRPTHQAVFFLPAGETAPSAEMFRFMLYNAGFEAKLASWPRFMAETNGENTTEEARDRIRTMTFFPTTYAAREGTRIGAVVVDCISPGAAEALVSLGLIGLGFEGTTRAFSFQEAGQKATSLIGTSYRVQGEARKELTRYRLAGVVPAFTTGTVAVICHDVEAAFRTQLLSAGPEVVKVQPKEEVDTATGELRTGIFDGRVDIFLTGVEKCYQPDSIVFGFSRADPALQDVPALRTQLHFYRLGDAREIDGKRMLENCSNCGGINWQHRPVRQKTTPKTTSISQNLASTLWHATWNLLDTLGPCSAQPLPNLCPQVGEPPNMQACSRQPRQKSPAKVEQEGWAAPCENRPARSKFATSALTKLMLQPEGLSKITGGPHALRKGSVKKETCNSWVAGTYPLDKAHDVKCKRFPCVAITTKSEEYYALVADFMKNNPAAAKTLAQPKGTDGRSYAAASSSVSASSTSAPIEDAEMEQE